MPTATDLVTDLPADFEVFGQAVATSLADLLGGASGYILAKNSATDMDFVWIANDQGDITGVTAGNGISVTDPTGPVPTVAINTAITADLTTAQTLTNKTLTSPVLTTPSISNINAKADILVGTADNTLGILSVGTNGHVLTADSTVSPTGLKWAASAGGGKVLQVVQGTYSTEQSSSSTTYVTTGLTVSITPTSATSKIYIHAIINGLTKSTGSANNASNIRLLRNAATTIITSTGINYTGADVANQGQGVIQYLDSPATTSATTYDVYFANRFASGTVYAQDGGANNQSIITVWEIGA